MILKENINQCRIRTPTRKRVHKTRYELLDFANKQPCHSESIDVGGIYKSGTAFSLQKQLQVIKSVILTGSIADAARENHVSDLTA